VPEEELHAWLDGALSRAQSAEIAEHLMGCLLCRAAHAEAVATRDRASALLAMAVPGGIRRQLPGTKRPAGRHGRVAAAVAFLVVGGTLANQPDTLALPAPRLSTMAFVAPALHAQIHDVRALDGAALVDGERNRLTHLAAMRPQVVMPSSRSSLSSRSVLLAPAAEVDPAMGWESLSWDDALVAAGGSLARLEGLPVTAVRIQRNGAGTRPTFFVKQRLAGGQSVWVVEGPEDRVEPVHAAIEASGLTSSLALRTRHDYTGTEEAPVRTLRVVTIAAALDKDTVDGLTARLRLE
jgi:hypothetical protein